MIVYQRNSNTGSLYYYWDEDVHILRTLKFLGKMPLLKSSNNVEKDKERPIKVYARVRPFAPHELDRNEPTAVETFDDGRRIKVIDTKHSQETTYHFDGVFTGEDTNEQVFNSTTKHLLVKLLNGMNCAVLAYGQTGSGKTFTLMSDGCITQYAITDLYKMIEEDKVHQYKVTCSFVQIYLEKVYDLLSSDNKDELPVREHPTKGIYVKNLSHHLVSSAEDVLELFKRGKEELITAETKMVRHSSRSHSIFQISIERRVDIGKINELLQSRELKSRKCELQRYLPDDIVLLEEEMVLRAKMDICDLAGSERLGKTLVEGINRCEAKYINSSLLQLGNVIYALSEGKRRHIPFRNSTLTRLLQECLGSQCKTSFIICAAPSASEAYETRCSLNFGTRARTITNKERVMMNVEVDYKLLSKRLSEKICKLEGELNKNCEIYEPSATMERAQLSASTQTKVAVDTTRGVYSVDNVKHILCISEMQEHILKHTNYDKVYNHDDESSLALILSMFTISTKQITNIVVEMRKDDELIDEFRTIEITEYLSKCAHRLERWRDKHAATKRCEKSDSFGQAISMISQICNDTKEMIDLVSKTPKDISGDVDEGSWYNRLHHTLGNSMINENDARHHNITYLYYLVHNLQIHQLILLTIEAAERFAEHSNSAMSVKPYTWSTSIEDVTSSDIGSNSMEDVYLSDHSTRDASSGLKRKKNEKRLDKSEGKYSLKKEKERRIHKHSLTRNHSFKIKSDDINRKVYYPRVSDSIVRSLSRESIDHSTLNDTCLTYDTMMPVQLKSLSFSDDVNHSSSNSCAELTCADEKSLDQTLRKEQQNTNELWMKYENMVEEKESLLSKMKELEQNNCMMKRERDYFENEVELRRKKCRKKQDEIEKILEENCCIRNKLQKSEKKRFENKQSITRLQCLLEERDKVIRTMELEGKVMCEKVEEYDDSERKVTNLKKEVEKGQANLQQCQKEFRKLCDEMIMISDVVNDVKFQESKRQTMSNIEDISSLETEFFNALECNVQYEAALNSIRRTLNQQLKNENTSNNSIDKPNEGVKSNVNKVVNSVSNKSKIGIKRSESMRQKHKKRLEELRKVCCEKPVSAAKELKACRSTRLKDLLREKVELNDRINKLEKKLSKKEEMFEQSKGQVAALVKELGNMDLEMNDKSVEAMSDRALLSGSSSNSLENRINIKGINGGEEKQLEIIGIPEIDYKEFMTYINNRSSLNTCLPRVAETMAKNEVTVHVTLELKKEIELHKRKYAELEQEYKKVTTLMNDDEVVTENQSLQRRVEYLQHSNTILVEENETLKLENRERKIQLKELRQKSVQIREELETYKHQYLQTKAKGESLKLQLEKKLSISKEKMISLENYIRQLSNELQLVERERKKSLNDSGLPQDDYDS